MTALSAERTPTRVRVRHWERESGAVWRRRGEIQTWEKVKADPRWLRAGTWEMDLPWGNQASRLKRSHLVTVDLSRGSAWARIMTGRVRSWTVGADERGRVILTVGGDGVVGAFGGVLIWPSPTQPLTSQPDSRYRADGLAEPVLRDLVTSQAITRLGLAFDVVGPGTLGTTIRLRERMSNLLEVLAVKAVSGGIGYRMGLVDDPISDMTARLQLEFLAPRDRSDRVQLSHSVGSLRTWRQALTAPDGTRALLMGDGEGAARKYRQAADPAAEAEWGWPAEAPVNGQGNDEELTLAEQAREGLRGLAAKQAFELEAVEATGQRLGQHFDLGDRVRVNLMTGLESTEVLEAVSVDAGAGGVGVKLVPGNPDGASPLFQLEAIIQALKAQVRALQREE